MDTKYVGKCVPLDEARPGSWVKAFVLNEWLLCFVVTDGQENHLVNVNLSGPKLLAMWANLQFQGKVQCYSFPDLLISIDHAGISVSINQTKGCVYLTEQGPAIQFDHNGTSMSALLKTGSIVQLAATKTAWTPKWKLWQQVESERDTIFEMK